jgi:tetratricopeptide (TPR) repeat protein
MRSAVRAAVLLLFAGLLNVSSVEAQRGGDEPQRPELPADADPNNSAAYHAYGMSRLRTHPKQAADAFYWAMRLDPTQAEPFYARRVALLMSNPRVLVRYMAGERRTIRSRDVQSADSLYRHSLMLQPFLYRELDRYMINEYVAELSRQIQMENSSLTTSEIEVYLERVMRQSGPSLRGWLEYSDNNMPGALGLYGDALELTKAKAPVHADRAHIYFLLGGYAEAAVEMQAALTELEKNERDNDVFLYYSKEFYELGLGMSLEASRRFDEALAAYGRALQEDLSYFPAHRRMATVALIQGDTAAALASFSLGAAIDGADAALRLEYGALLLGTGDAAGAAAEMRRLTDDEPYFATGWLLLGGALEMSGQTNEASEAYDRFLALARRDHPDRPGVAAHVASLRGGADAAQ